MPLPANIHISNVPLRLRLRCCSLHCLSVFLPSSHSLSLQTPELQHTAMAPTYRPYAAEYGRGDAVAPYGVGGGERKQPARWVAGLGLGASSAWCLGDPEMKRRRRVASYKAYAVEGKVKSSIRRGLRWIKAKCSHIVHG